MIGEKNQRDYQNPTGMGALAVTAMKFLFSLRRDGIEAGKGRKTRQDEVQKEQFFSYY